MDKKNLDAVLASCGFLSYRYHETIGSTNSDALNWVEEGAPDGSLVVADRQTAGRGRLGRSWVTNSGAGLAFSLILHPTQDETDHAGLFTALGAIGTASALSDCCGLAPQIKWPNDVLLERKKVAGILVESAWVGEKLQAVIIGIGVNVAPKAVPPPNELIYPATSVEDILNRSMNRWELLKSILINIQEWRPRLGSSQFIETWEQLLAYQGEWVTIKQPGQANIEGKVVGIDRDGSLCLETIQEGKIHVVVGDVHLRPNQ